MKTKTIYILAVIVCSIMLVSAPAFAMIVLELHSDTTDGSTTFTDSSASGHTITATGTVQHSTEQAKTGASSMYFNGSGNYFEIADDDDWYFGSGSFTVDFWAYTKTWVSDSTLWAQQQSGSGPYNNVMYSAGSGNVQWSVYNGGTLWGIPFSAPSVNEWNHYAFVRNGTSVKIYVNAVEVGSATSAAAQPNQVAPFTINRRCGNTIGNDIYIDDFYVRNGDALTPQAITDIVNTPNELRENLTAGISSLGITTYSTAEVQLLYQLYSEGNLGSNPSDVTVDGTTWRYYATLDNQGGRPLGDGYTYNDRMHIYLGSGLAEVPVALIRIEDANTFLSLGYSEAEMDQLLALYDAGKALEEPADIIIQGTKWRYFAELPGEGGRDIGEAYTINGQNFIYLGSGVGEVPEVPKGGALYMALVLGIGLVLLRKRFIPDGRDRFSAVE